MSEIGLVKNEWVCKMRLFELFSNIVRVTKIHINFLWFSEDFFAHFQQLHKHLSFGVEK